jgi:hypothetical protein
VGVTDVPALPRAKGQLRPAESDTEITPRIDARIRDVFDNEIREFGYARPAGSRN